MKLVVVESPAKAKTINKYLGKDYKVLASYGHIRDLPSKDGSVDPEKDFSMVWELSSGLGKFHNRIVNAGETGSIADLSGCGFGVGDTQVFSYGPVEKRCVLRNDGDVLKQGAELQIPNVGVVNEDFAGGNVIGAQEQADEGGFSGA